MPWKIDDVEKHKKGLSPEQKKLWVRVANANLKSHGNELRAIMEANKAADKVLHKRRYNGRDRSGR